MIIDKIFIIIYTLLVLIFSYAIYNSCVIGIYAYLAALIPLTCLNIIVLIYLINEYKNNHRRISQQ